jgi:hypothetical protein
MVKNKKGGKDAKSLSRKKTDENTKEKPLNTDLNENEYWANITKKLSFVHFICAINNSSGIQPKEVNCFVLRGMRHLSNRITVGSCVKIQNTGLKNKNHEDMIYILDVCNDVTIQQLKKEGQIVDFNIDKTIISKNGEESKFVVENDDEDAFDFSGI